MTGPHPPRTFDCGGPDRCFDDLCHGAEIGICGRWSDRLIKDDWGDEDEFFGWPSSAAGVLEEDTQEAHDG